MMSYEKELEYLRKEFNKSSAKFHQAEAEGYETDAEMWGDDMVNIGHQIHIHEQAAKAGEYKAKAKAFDEIKVYMQSAEDKLCDEEYFNDDVYEEYFGIIETVIEHYSEKESGEQDA